MARVIKTLTLDNPEKSNALSAAAVEKLLEGVTSACRDGTETLVFTGQGRNFCTGFDLSDLDTATDAGLLERFVKIEELLQAIYMAPFDTVCCAKGATWGAGADIFAACRWRLADESARFAMPGLQFGIVLGTRRLGALIGEGAAYELLASGRPIDAHRALELGLASAIEPEARWPALIEERHSARRLKGEALARLAAQTRRDTCAADMKALVESASVPGLVERIRRYRAGLKKR
jgi:enoyl-CoA hydratase/carnithine racemase